jgi:type II secretory pathway component PulJ
MLKRAAGFSLVELMIAMTAAIVVIGAGVSVISSTLGGSTSSTRMTRMNQDLRTTLNFVSADLTRIGSWGLAGFIADAATTSDLSFGATTGTDVTVTLLKAGTSTTNSNALAFPSYISSVSASSATTGPLTGLTLYVLFPGAGGASASLQYLTIKSSTASTLTVDITGTLPSATAAAGSWTVNNPFTGVTLGNANGSGGYGCILFTYDSPNPDAYPNGILDSNEHFGYRFDSTNGQLLTTNSATSCSSGSWQPATDPNLVRLNSFVITTSETSAPAASLLTATLRQYKIQMSGTLSADASSTRNLEETVKVRNNVFQ